jgi:TfoX/Sxy family transcriptional regulator of competence genes
MKWIRSSRGLVDIFEHLVPDARGVEKRKMFGYPCSFVNGNMFVGLYQENMFLRLSDNDRAAFLKFENARLFEPMPGRPMKEYVVVPQQMLSKILLKKWIRKSLEYASELPPKVRKGIR